MAIVKEYQAGNCRIYVHDDSIVKTKEEQDAILKTLKEIAERSEARLRAAPEEKAIS